ncbi:CoA-transferase [Dankookia sp. P2]|uniref:CoA-transferase n=1 Tax=Dankookia sp. P2 TaxID=3423955 RepID=UPI003D66EF77
MSASCRRTRSSPRDLRRPRAACRGRRSKADALTGGKAMNDTTQGYKPLGRTGMAARLAQDIPEGWYVNLGIGIPTLVADHIPADREVVVHSENGILGVAAAPEPHKENPWLINASSQRVSLRPGGSFFHHADSFAMVRGGHLDLCVLGGFQVAANGDLANGRIRRPRRAGRSAGRWTSRSAPSGSGW